MKSQAVSPPPASYPSLRMGNKTSRLGLARKRTPTALPCISSPEKVAQAMALKDLGNEQFKAGQFKEAEELYTQA
jgi:hypothetical protein